MFLYAHSGFRYLVLLGGLLVIGYAVFGLVTKRDYDTTMRALAAAFTGLIDLTVLLGLATLLTGSFYPQLGGHIVMMVFAAIVAHAVSAVMKRRPPEERTFMPHVIGTTIVMAIILAGIMAVGSPIVG